MTVPVSGVSSPPAPPPLPAPTPLPQGPSPDRTASRSAVQDLLGPLEVEVGLSELDPRRLVRSFAGDLPRLIAEGKRLDTPDCD